nr:immunoglobulin light chain junction region [Macaca mulatta]
CLQRSNWPHLTF